MSMFHQKAYPLVTKLACVLFATTILSSCTPNPVVTYYRGTQDARVVKGYDKSVIGAPILYPTADLKNEVRNAKRKGFQPIGESHFFGPSNSPIQQGMRQQAVLIGAHLVLYSVNYKDTISGVAPIVIPKTSTTVSNANVSAFGSGGYANAYGTGTSTTYGTQVVPMSYSVDRSNFDIVFFAKGFSRLGISYMPITDNEISAIQSNEGVKADVITEGSSAFQAEILPGDILLAMNGEKITMSNFSQLLEKYEGQTVKINIFRNGSRLVKNVEIRRYPL